MPVKVEGTGYYCAPEGTDCQHGGPDLISSYRDCSMHPEDCPEPGICMSAMDVPGICGFNCATNSECESAFGLVHAIQPKVFASTKASGLVTHECRPVADGPAECDLVMVVAWHAFVKVVISPSVHRKTQSLATITTENSRAAR